MGSPSTPGTATPSYAAAASSMATAKYMDALDEKPGLSSGAIPKPSHSQYTRKVLKRRSKAAPRLNHRHRGRPYYKGHGGRATVFHDALRDWLPGQLFEHGHKKSLFERVEALLPNGKAARKAEHQQEVHNERTTTLEMRRCTADGELSQASSAEETGGFWQRIRRLTGLADNTTNAPMRARRVAKAARSVTQLTSDTAAPNHRSVARVSAPPVAGQQRPVRRQARPRGTGRRPEARVNTFLQSCMFVLSAVLVVLLLPALTLLTPYMRGAGEAAAYVGEAALETVQPVHTYQLPGENASNCVRRRRFVIGTSLTPVKVNAARTVLKQPSFRLPVIRRRRLVCLYKEAPDTTGLLDDLFNMCTDVAYGQFYVDKAGLFSKQPTLDHRLPDKSRYAHPPRILGWLGGELSDAGDFSRLAGESAKTLQSFAHNFATWLQAWSFDGAHLDWRYPGGPCEVADDYNTFVRLLQLLRNKTRLLSVALPYKEAILARRFDIKSIASLADMLVVSTDETLAEDYTGQPSCPGAALPQVAASLWRVRRMADASELQQRQAAANRDVQLCHTVSLASIVYYRSFAQPSNLSKGLFVVSSVVPYSDHCLKKAGYRNQPLFNEPGCTALVRENNNAPRVIASAGPDDLRRRLEQAYVVHDFGHECVAAAALTYDDYAGHCGLGRWPLLRALY